MAFSYKDCFEIINDKVVAHIPIPGLGMGVYRSINVIDKKTFIKCYEMWILNKEECEEVAKDERLQNP